MHGGVATLTVSLRRLAGLMSTQQAPQLRSVAVGSAESPAVPSLRHRLLLIGHSGAGGRGQPWKRTSS